MDIIVKNLTHMYNPGLPYESVALDDVSFEIKDGEFIGIIGHTGSGKSTLLQHLNGLLKPSSGQIIIDGTDITAQGVLMKEVRQKVGLVFQYPEYQLFEETLAKDVAFGPKNIGLQQDAIEERVKKAIELVGLDYEELSQRSPFDLSGGQKRRAAMAGVLAMEPKALILDEPTAGLDPGAHAEILDMVYRIHKSQKNITVLVSHNMSDTAKLCDRILVMEKGKIILSGTPAEVFKEKELLENMGLALPPVTDLMFKLAELGVPVRTDVLDIDGAEQALYEVLSR